MNIPKFVLASASPARRKLLQNAGIEPVVCQSDFDESQIDLTNPINLVETLALSKAQTVRDKFTNALILGCDSVLSIQGEIHGKPANPEDAIARWQKMRGNVGILYTGHALIDISQDQTIVKCGITKVYFANASDRAIAAYVATGEPLNCAGCFAIEGRGGLFVEKLEGCHTNVIGLSLPLLYLMLDELGYNAIDFWSQGSGGVEESGE
ncbi:MAG TPA: septum formation inhibitor Maf [Cyanobacteria bacterium UBA11149]|nr:septum formation inhibitor Maf [Cyanobacteria bacterium UBA11367]HBE59781.1 septum formation inhibitor Maf [Cyanobacteria bacterium UBA11366]HBK64267.1 septum formation inhibitor Maf [Cyanobacteria bacterium UBA11166]HBR72355.1 septum formation inhibitor Maf [Cyanobacteria bacterium UBA11159]HBS70860.1 septum formation inhibitor Maf [Cyanobacteria bacterium UBA11153]HBW89524.1 septum formation inhibitor Maf [Cyanobacteria bacterium UBA11149]HCA94936.1 septum formation inhibitor Maf [Cyanob